MDQGEVRMIMDSVLAQLLESPKMIEPDNEHIEQYLLAGATSELAFNADGGAVRGCAVAGFAAPVRAVFDEGEKLATMAQVLASVG
jgi:hypothetical protein